VRNGNPTQMAGVYGFLINTERTIDGSALLASQLP